ncbi:MAG: imidazolonepropionase [Candidatus Paceibacterota bacterium]|jgi:imidazolonepropionase|nr:imidazolonepropionase [Candidatus Paceibacterota bacterium]
MLIIKNIKELATCAGDMITDAMIVVVGEKIIAVGKTDRLKEHYHQINREDKIINASGMIAIPGFVDCHTHAVFAGSRANEYSAKIRGKSYSDVQKMGGGIRSTVIETRNASEDELYASARSRLREMLRCGTTTVEIKSGYGLNVKDELKILRVIKRLQKSGPQDIIATFLGAHTIPKEYAQDREGYVDLIIRKMLPVIAEEKLAENADVFCDPLGFTPEETEKIFTEARRYGLKLHIHGEQTAHFGGAKVAAKFGAVSLDHGDYLDDDDISQLKRSGTTVVLLPGVLMHCMDWGKTKLADTVAKLKAAGILIAFATDYNPGSAPLLSMKLVMDLGMRLFKMNSKECLRAATINAAQALDMSKMIGSIEAGKQADILLVSAHSVEDYLYQIGDRHFDLIIKRGRIQKQ